jgi:adenylate kinase family enzyme
MRIIAIIGLPGSGKGTLCQHIIRNHNCLLLTAGEMLRNTQDDAILKIINAGQLVPSSTIVSLMHDEIKKNINNKYDFVLLDGFPRSVDNMQHFEQTVAKINVIVNLTTSVDIICSRLRARQDNRKDDQDDTIIQQRIVVYNKQTAPVVQGSGVINIDSSGSSESVYKKFLTDVLH